MDFLREQPDGWWVKISDMYNAGTPDVMGHIGGIFGAIELKREAGVVSPLQEWVLKQIEKTGGMSFVCRSLDEVKRAVETLRRKSVRLEPV